MNIYREQLGDVERYLTKRASIRLEEKEDRHQSLLRCLNAVTRITPETRMLEVGTGLGLFPIWCALRGLSCKGLEISPQLIEYAHSLAREYGVEIDILLGNLEEYSMPPKQFDVIVAASLFEHVQLWRQGLSQVYRWLRPGGLLLFESPSKFTFKNGEFARLPLYGWLPDPVRYRLRQLMQGKDIMKLGIDFHQFTQGGLRRAFRETGFSRVYDRVDLSDPDNLTGLKRAALMAARNSPHFRRALLTFMKVAIFVCVK
jgi:SAM-dependent methyltransferase